MAVTALDVELRGLAGAGGRRLSRVEVLEGRCPACWLYQHGDCERGGCSCEACGGGRLSPRSLAE